MEKWNEFFGKGGLNFKNKDDVEEYLESYQKIVLTQKGVGLEDFFICRLSDTSLLIFCTIDTEENGKKIIEFADEWRKENKFEITDSMVLDGKLEGYFNLRN